MKKCIVICVTVLAITSTSVLAGGSKRPPRWPLPPAMDFVVDVEQNLQS